MAALRVDVWLVSSFIRTGGLVRGALVAACTAVVSGLLLVALTVVLFAVTPSAHGEPVSGLISDGGVRGGYVFALLLICLAPLTLLRQVVRLGTAAREQRLAALRLAGATPGDVRRLGALEVGVPAMTGGLLGYLVFQVLAALFGGGPAEAMSGSAEAESQVARQLRLVPTTVHPTWGQVLLVAVGVGLVGVLAGYITSRSLMVSPLGISRRTPRTAPRPWGAVLLALAVPSLLGGVSTRSDALVFAAIACSVLGILLLAPWVAHLVGRAVAARASTVPVLVAARRLTTDARPAGRAAAAIGAIAMVAATGGALLADLPSTDGGIGFEGVDPFYTVPLAMVGAVLVVALVLVVFSLAAHGVESLVDRKRSFASLAALGATTDELESVQRWEVALVAVPMAVVGVAIGSWPALALLGAANRYAWIPVLVDAATLALVWLSVRASAWVTRPWLRRATTPANLRTP